MTDPAPAPQTAQTGARDAAGALAGVLVADFSRVLAGPYATQLLADLGADVIKVEAPIGDETRGWLPPEHGGVSTYYLGVNRNKRGMVLDFDDPTDLGLAQELAARADVIIENFRPGGLRRFGLDYESVRSRNGDVVYVSISGFGSADGASLPGYDLLVQAASGLMSLTGDADGTPYRSGVSVFDVMTGMNAVIGLLAALRHRDRTGEGQHVEVNLLSTALAAMANHSSTYITSGRIPYRMGNAHPSLFPYEPLPAADGDIVIVASTDRQFATLVRALGIPEVLDDPRFRSVADRNLRRAELRPILVEALAERTVQAWFELLTAAGVPCGPVSTIDGGFVLADRLGLEPVVRIAAGEDELPVVRNPIRFSRTAPRYHRPPPTLGQHDQELRAWLSTKETT